MITINLKGRVVPLIYTVWEMKLVQEGIGPLNKAISIVLGKIDEDGKDAGGFGSAEQLNAAAKLIRILGNAGLEEAGEPADLTEKKIMRALKPADFPTAINACMDAMNEGMSSEIPEEKTTGPVDVVLEELRKKKETDD